jgi:hypothetical protein
MSEQKLAPAGNNPCTVLDGFYGQLEGKPVVRVNVRMDAGPTAGRIYTYEEDVNNKSSIYIDQSLTAIGWKGATLNSVAADVAAWVAKTGGKTTIEIQHLVIKKGKRAGEIWDKPRNIGRGPKPLEEAKGDLHDDAEQFMRNARELAGRGAPPADDVPHASERDPDDLPFARAHGSEPSAIASVLRGAL